MRENNEEKVKKLLETDNIPENLSPDNIRQMLDEKAPAKKRKRITRKAARITAGAAACAVICGFGVHFAGQENLINQTYSEVVYETMDESSETALAPGTSGSASQLKNTYMNSAKSYEEIYTLFEKASEKHRNQYKNNYFYSTNGGADIGITGDFITDTDIMSGYGDTETAPEADSVVKNEPVDNSSDFSGTYNQEEGVFESDIFKTDGRYIYYLTHCYEVENYKQKPYLNIAETENGSFSASDSIDISADINIDIIPGVEGNTDYSVSGMYLYNDKLIIIGNVNEYSYSTEEPVVFNGDMEIAYESTAKVEAMTFVNLYSVGISPELIGSYTQDGRYNDVRITPDGYMYLITDHTTQSFSTIKAMDQIEAYIPSYTIGTDSACIAADDILLPNESLQESAVISYTVIGSLDLNSDTGVIKKDIKAIAGFSGKIYCSEKNLYTVNGRDETAITRISLDNGIISPAAEGTVKGYIKDQFSMSENDGYFRIATTYEKWEEKDDGIVVSYGITEINNYVYVLDMNLDIVGSISDFGINETVKSVNFSGNMAYVVTYEQTDPLFSIDLSNPSEPVILDEYKLPGYSTYMQQWEDGLLLGFGVNADEEGIENGVKLVMFDNSDPTELGEVDSYVINANNKEMLFLMSHAVYERKALLIAPEKNVIAVPIEGKYSGASERGYYSAYIFFSFKDGKFVKTGEIGGLCDSTFTDNAFRRALYIGDYVYALSSDEFISADIETLTEKDKVQF